MTRPSIETLTARPIDPRRNARYVPVLGTLNVPDHRTGAPARASPPLITQPDGTVPVPVPMRTRSAFGTAHAMRAPGPARSTELATARQSCGVRSHAVPWSG